MRMRITSTWRIQIKTLIFFHFYSSKVDFNKFRLKNKKQTLRASALYQILDSMLWEGDRHVRRGENLFQTRWQWSRERHRHKTWCRTGFTVMSFLIGPQSKCSENPRRRTFIEIGKWRDLARSATWTGPWQMRGHPNRWDCGSEDIELGKCSFLGE